MKSEMKDINIGFIIFLFIFIPMLLILLSVIIKSIIHPDKVPDVLGFKPFIVISDTKTEIEKNDLILTKVVKEDEVQIGDIISFQNNGIIEVHEVIDVVKKDINTFYIIDIAENDEPYNVSINNQIVEGRYLFRIEKLGGILLQVQSYFIIIVIVLGIVLGIYTILSNKRLYEKSK